jgi:hypothetical protein
MLLKKRVTEPVKEELKAAAVLKSAREDPLIQEESRRSYSQVKYD